MTKRIGGEHAIPRTVSEWRARIRDAIAREEPIGQPLPDGAELGFRIGVLFVVAVGMAMLLSLMASPLLGAFGHTVHSVARRFDTPLGDADLPAVAQRSVVVDRKGRVLGTLIGDENRIVVPLKSVPKVTQDAVIATEDAKFYTHHGVDLAGLTRALVTNVRSGDVVQGGSTITQQLVKNRLVGSERSLDRKIKEARYAVALEKKMTKERILEAYLNEAYFGNGQYGIGTAAEYYFGVPVQRLSLAQSAMLAGIIKSPEEYEPFKNPKAARARRAIVLQRMIDEGYITAAQQEAGNKVSLGAKKHLLPQSATPYFIEYVKNQIEKDPRFGETVRQRINALFGGGLRIETTLDLDLQEDAQAAVNGVLNRPRDPEAALVSVDPKTGAVRAIISGRNFEKEHFDLAVQGRRQPGSTFKPFTMIAALAAGMAPTLEFNTPSPLIVKDPGTGKEFPVGNYDERGHGIVNMNVATEQSINTYYMQLIQKVGAQKVADMAALLGIQTELDPVLALTLGTTAVSPFEMASAYATLANDGVYCSPFAIVRVLDAAGREIMKNDTKCDKVIEPELARRATDILRGVPERGTGRANGRIGRPVTGKTGTTDNYFNSWYVGYTPQFSTAVWLGYLKDASGKPCECVPLHNVHGLPRVFGGSLPATIWSRFMRAAHAGLPIERFPTPKPYEPVPLPDVTGKTLADARKALADAGFPTTKVEEVASNRPEGTVVGMTPSPGEQPYGVAIVLRVSSGGGAPPPPPPPPSPTPTPTPTPSPTETKKGGGGGNEG